MSLCQHKLDCKKDLFFHHQAGCLEVAANLLCTSPHNQWAAWSGHVPQRRSLSLPFSLLPSIQSLVSVLLVSCLKPHTCSSCPLASSCCCSKCPSRGQTRTSFYTQVQVHTCQPPFLPPAASSFHCLPPSHMIATGHMSLFQCQLIKIQ